MKTYSTDFEDIMFISWEWKSSHVDGMPAARPTHAGSKSTKSCSKPVSAAVTITIPTVTTTTTTEPPTSIIPAVTVIVVVALTQYDIHVTVVTPAYQCFQNTATDCSNNVTISVNVKLSIQSVMSRPSSSCLKILLQLMKTMLIVMFYSSNKRHTHIYFYIR